MFRLFKTKEEKQKDKQKSLEKELQEFTDKYKQYFNCYAFTGKDVVLYKEPKIVENELIISLIKADTPKGYEIYQSVWLLNFQHGEEFLKRHRHNFIKLKDQMEKLELSVTKIKEI